MTRCHNHMKHIQKLPQLIRTSQRLTVPSALAAVNRPEGDHVTSQMPSLCSKVAETSLESSPKSSFDTEMDIFE